MPKKWRAENWPAEAHGFFFNVWLTSYLRVPAFRVPPRDELNRDARGALTGMKQQHVSDLGKRLRRFAATPGRA
jgi:hypothetical protein